MTGGYRDDMTTFTPYPQKPFPSYFYSQNTMSAWTHNTTRTSTTQKKACPFSIDAILSENRPSELTAPAAMKMRHCPTSTGHQFGNHDTNLLHPLYFVHQHHGVLNQTIYHGPPYSISREILIRRTCRRVRTTFTEDQLRKLEDVFSRQRYMTGAEKMLLASALGLTETQVKVWFQNRRTRWRKSNTEEREQKITTSANVHNRVHEDNELISVDSDDSWGNY